MISVLRQSGLEARRGELLWVTSFMGKKRFGVYVVGEEAEIAASDERSCPEGW